MTLSAQESDLRTALKRLLAVIPPYVGLAVYLDAEKAEFHEAEKAVVNAVYEAQRVLEEARTNAA